MYPTETVILCVIGAGLYYAYYEISKFWNKPLFITAYGEWRVLRYIGRLTDFDDKKLFRPETSQDLFKATIKIQGQPKLPIILNKNDIKVHKPNKIIMNKKYIYWDMKEASYFLSEKQPIGYQIDPVNLDRFTLAKIDNIDVKAVRAARSSPVVIHQGYMQNSIPLEPGDYKEEDIEDLLELPSEYMFKRDKIGGYRKYSEMDEDEDDIDKDD